MSKEVIKEENAKTIDSSVKTKEEVKEQAKPQDTKKDKAKKEKKKGPGLLRRKVSETGAELKRVAWPSFGSVVKKTGVVLAFCAFSLVVLLLVDVVLKFLVGLLGL